VRNSRLIRRQDRVHRLTAVLLFCLVTAFTFAIPAPAQAASCKGSSCNGKDPESSGCRAAGSVNEFDQYVPDNDTVWMRRSPSCQANWARIIHDDDCWRNDAWGRWIRVQSQAWSPYGYFDVGDQVAAPPTCAYYVGWTKMVPAIPTVGGSGYRARICWAYYYYYARPSTWDQCSPWSYY
jgi:Protein of unknown function (DUF2690)